MSEESDHPTRHSQGAVRGTARRTLLQLPLSALGTWLALKTVAGCASDGDARRPAPAAPPAGPGVAPNAPSSPSPPSAPPPNSPSPQPSAATAAGPQAGQDGGAALARACAKPTTFAPIVDEGLRTAATRTDQTDTLDWLTMTFASSLYQATLPDTLIGLLRTLGGMHLGYPINLLDHSLQAATRARRAGASDDLVLAALFHHVGMALSVEGYAELSAAIVRGYVSEDAYKIMRHHPEYAWTHFGALSGKPTDQRARFAGQSFHADAVRFADDWERVAYDPAYPSLPLADFEALVRDRFSSLTSELYTTHGDCIRGSEGP